MKFGSKGIEKSTTLYLILALAAAVILSFLVVVYAIPGGSDIFNMLTGILSQNPNEPDALAQAIRCAYYRCEVGCDAVKSMDFPVGSMQFPCAQFCKNEWTDSNGKICGWNAQQFPVEVEVDDGTLTKRIGGDLDMQCIVRYSGWTNIWSQAGADGDVNVLIMDPSLAKSGGITTESCSLGALSTDTNAVKSFEADVGKYAYIAAAWDNSLFKNEMRIAAMTAKPYYSISGSGPIIVQTETNRITRIDVDGLGDVLVEPKSVTAQRGGSHPSYYPTWLGMDVICPDGIKSSMGDFAACQTGKTFCYSVNIKCIALSVVPAPGADAVLTFQVSVAGGGGAR